MAGAKKGSKQVRQITREEMQEYGSAFRSVRESLGLSLTQMGEEIGVHYTVLSRWEKAISIPNVDIKYVEQKIKNIAKKYNVEVI